MKGRFFVLLLAPLLVLTASTAAAQITGITGSARDTTGAVLPGVTVEVASPALIEKVRVAVTDGQGRFLIADLRPGTYSVTFSLVGFSTYRREGIELSAGFTATVNGDLKVGALEETITVTGASPVVDAQNARTQQVLKFETLEALPTGARDLGQYAALTLGATSGQAARNDVGGALSEMNNAITIHGGRGDDGRSNYDGMGTNNFFGYGGGQNRIFKFNTLAVQETVVDTGGSTSESETGGANINMVPREGGNLFTLHSVLAYTNHNFASGKVGDALIARGSQPYQKTMKEVRDFGVGVGGRIVRDRLWFYGATRWWGGQNYGANVIYFNKSPLFYRYEPDLSRRAFADSWQRHAGGRFTLQASPKHKFNSTLEWEQGCGCWQAISQGALSSPEATTSFYYGKGQGMWLSQTSWTYPATNRLLFQAGAQFLIQSYYNSNAKLPGPNDVAILEQTTGLRWGALPGSLTGNAYFDAPNVIDHFSQRFAVSYITGSHAFKTGLQTSQGVVDQAGNAPPNGVNYTFRNGVPISLTQFASPFRNSMRVRLVGLFAQDQWTINRLSLNLGVRFDHALAYVRAITVPAGPFIGERSYPEVREAPNLKDITPRLGASFDVFGNGRTALKGSFGRYLIGVGTQDTTANSPALAVFASTDRQWNDLNGNFVPDCDLRNLQANSECGTVANLGFGQRAPVTRWAESARTGWGVREYSYQTSLALQHELLPGFGLTVGYYRTDWRGQQAIVNTAVGASDFTPFCLTVPTDPRLGSLSGQQICGLYDVVPAKLGVRDAVQMLAKDVPGRAGLPKEVYNGVDIAINARFGTGGILAGGVAFGRTVFDYCWQNALPEVTQVGKAALGFVQVAADRPRTESHCRIQSPLWDGVGSQIKLQAVYTLPWDFAISGVYKHLPGVPISATYIVPNALVAPSLGRDLAACRGASGAACTASVSMALLPVADNQGNQAAVKFDDRLNQVDLRLTRTFRIARGRLQGALELYNVLNARPAQANVITYGSSWLLPSAILGGRLLKFAAQIDF